MCPHHKTEAWPNAIRQIGVNEMALYRWRQKFGRLKIRQVRRLKEPGLESGWVRKTASDPTLDKLILTEATTGNFFSIRCA